MDKYITTKKGDTGMTDIKSGPVTKNHELIHVLGQFDEASSFIGLARAHIKDDILAKQLCQIQEDLQVIMGIVSGYGKQKDFDMTIIHQLESYGETYKSLGEKITGFVIPGENSESAYLDVARSLIRRVERYTYASEDLQNCPGIRVYVNRLSDVLYLMARYIDNIEKLKDRLVGEISTRNKPIKENGRGNSMNLELANWLIEKVKAKAGEIQLPVVITVADEAGHLTALHRMDDALIASIDIATNKAFTAVAVKMSTEELGKHAGDHGSLFGIGDTNNGRIITFGGGVPLHIQGQLIGGIGVSGGTTEQDVFLAEYGAKCLKKITYQN